MRGHSSWNYTPYRLPFREVGDIYISRVVPLEHAVHFEWLAEEGKTYAVYSKKRYDDDNTFRKVADVCDGEVDLLDLETETDYAFYVECEGKKSRIRIARTGKPIGITVNYLHPEDDAYAFSGNYLASPTIVRHPDGHLLASMDIFGIQTPQNLTLIFRSDDDGETWHYVTELCPCFWGKLFIHKGEVYMLSVSTEYGDLLIGKSSDGGKTWGAPTVILRGSCKTNFAGCHKSPMNIVNYNGRIYETMEWGSWREGYHAPMVMSCDENDDLLVPENWSFAEPIKYDPNWEGTAEGYSSGCIEGTLVIFPNGKLYNVMRYDMFNTTPNFGLALAFEVNKEDHEAPLTYSHPIEFPANHSKFIILKDEVSGKYYTVASRIRNHTCKGHRNLLSLMCSEDMVKWDVMCDVIDRSQEHPGRVGFQYVDFIIEGDDILMLIRSGYNYPSDFHNSNYCTFLRLKNFRDIKEEYRK